MSRFALYFIATALTLSLLPQRVQAALPKELPALQVKFLTGACLTRSEDLWITAEAGGVYRLSGQEMKPKWEDMRKQPGRLKKESLFFSKKLHFNERELYYSQRFVQLYDSLCFSFVLFRFMRLCSVERQVIVCVRGNHFPGLISCTHTP